MAKGGFLILSVELCRLDFVEKFLAGVDSNLSVNVADMGLCGAERDGEFLLDVLRRATLSDENEHLVLTFGQITFLAESAAALRPHAFVLGVDGSVFFFQTDFREARFMKQREDEHEHHGRNDSDANAQQPIELLKPNDETPPPRLQKALPSTGRGELC